MSDVNLGQQEIGWKFSTPLKADYLNTFIAGLSNPGLLTRPKFTVTQASVGAQVLISPFSLFIVPKDKESDVTDENNEIVDFKLVKVSVTSNITVNITTSAAALGFVYSFANDEAQLQAQWYGEVQVLTPEDLVTFKGVIIATCQSFTYENKTYYSVSTNGADISDALLVKEGWNPMKWLSVVHPFRTSGGIYNQLEVRTHNGRFNGYVNSEAGLNRMTNLTYTMDTDVDPVTNPDGIRGLMPDNFNAFILKSDGFSLYKSVSELPMTQTSGSIFALVDATAVNERGLASSFVNKLKISPVEFSQINSYVENHTLYIR